MAQAGYTPIQLYYSTTASAAPSSGNLANGELAINITDGKLYYKDNGGTVRVLAGTGGTGVVAGSNTQVQFNNNGVFGASSGLTFDGTTLTANALTVTNATTLSAGTANGVAYLNGSKVLTSGSALTFDGSKLTVGTATAAGALTIVAPASTAYGAFDAPTAGFAFTDYKYNGTRYGLIGQAGALFSGASQTDFGILASSSLVMGASGSEQMRLTSTGLGIGTSSPGARLQVGDAGSSAPVKILIRSASADTYLQSTSTGSVVGTPNGVPLLFNTNDAERARITPGGDFLLGYTSNTFLGSTTFSMLSYRSGNNSLGVAGGSYTSAYYGQLYLTGGYGDGTTARTSGFFIRSQASGGGGNVVNELLFIAQTDNGNSETTAMRINNTQQLLVAASSTQGTQKLTVQGDIGLQAVVSSSGDAFPSLLFYNNNSSGFTNAAITATVGTTINSGNILFKTNNSGNYDERVRIAQTGYVGIATTNPQYPLDISQTLSHPAADGTPAFRINTRMPGAYLGSSSIMWTWTDYGNSVNWDVAKVYGQATDWSGSGSASGAIVFATKTLGAYASNTISEKARITGGGNLLVGSTSDSGSRIRVASASSGWSFQSNDIYRVFNNYAAYGSTSTTRTCSIAFTSQSNNWSGHVVEIIFASAWDVSSAVISGKATYTVTSLTSLAVGEIEDIGTGVSFAASTSGTTLTITATTTTANNWAGWTVRVTSSNNFSAPTSISIA